MKKNKKEIEFLLKFSIRQLEINNRTPNINFREINWEYIINQADYHQVSPYIYVNLKKVKRSSLQKIKKKFKLRYVFSLSQYLRLKKHFKDLISILKQNNIEFVPLKGFALIKPLYKEPFVRITRDIDILVPETKLKKVDKILEQNGYKKSFSGLSEKYYRKHHCHYMYFKNGRLLEVHWALTFNKPYKLSIPNLWKRTQNLKFENFTIKTLSLEDTLISLILHQRRFDKPLYLKSLIDIDLFLRKYQNSINWDYIIKIAFKNKLKHPFYLIFFTLKQLFDTPIPKTVMKKFHPNNIKKFFLSHILQKYLFHPKIQEYHIRKSFYLKLNFIWYDTLWDTLIYIFWLPQEKFAKYYKLDPYSYKTSYLYKIRFIYIPFTTIVKLLKKLYH